MPAVEEETDAEDYLVADEPVDIRDLVEDAILLALPMVPRKPGLEEAKAGGRNPRHGRNRRSRRSRPSRSRDSRKVPV